MLGTLDDLPRVSGCDSPCTDTGDNAALPPDQYDLDGDGNTIEPLPVDFVGQARIYGGHVDRGAYETTDAVCLRGDLNCDGVVNFRDINPFVLYLSNFSAWQAAHPACAAGNGDVNGDGTYPSFQDINPFVALLSGGGSSSR